MSLDLPAVDLQPVKASLVADLVDLINVNLADVLQVGTMACPSCKGRGITGSDEDEATCAQCGGVGAIESFTFDMERFKTPRFGRLVEGWDVKQGQIIPKMRSKDRAFTTLVRILGFDKAVLEVAAGVAFADTLSDDQRAQYVQQVAELAKAGMLDGR